MGSEGGEVYLEPGRLGDPEVLRRLYRRSVDLHKPWVFEPPNMEAYLQRAHRRLIRVEGIGEPVGQLNLGDVIRGPLQQAFLGYCIFSPYQGRGYMGRALPLMVAYAFGEVGLHRLEANIQPGNVASIALVRRAGFRKEGFSPRYLNFGEGWRDHERWAITAEEA